MEGQREMVKGGEGWKREKKEMGKKKKNKRPHDEQWRNEEFALYVISDCENRKRIFVQ